MGNSDQIRILAIASSGGHWIELLRLRPAWDGCRVSYVTTKSGYRDEVIQDAKERSQPTPQFFRVINANRWQKIRLLGQAIGVLLVLLRVRPHVIVSTGASLGFFALKIGKILGARTIWVDSIANVEELSLSGKMAGACADLWLTQWPQLAGSENPDKGLPAYKGSVI